MRIHWLQHVPFEGLGVIEHWAQTNHHTISATRFHQQDRLPPVDAFNWLIVMGGPMGVYDTNTYPWLDDETRLIEQAIAGGKSVLGICLGAQLIAAALGARVFPNNQKEIGWFPVTLTPEGRRSPFFPGGPRELTVFHWHGDTFALPAGATRLAGSAACANQAFLHGNCVLALQFHLEVTPEGVRRLIDNCGDELVDGPTIQGRERLLAGSQQAAEMHASMRRILDQLQTGDQP